MDGIQMALFHQRTALDDHLARAVTDVVAGRASEDARTERSDHGAGIDDGAHLDAELGAAVALRDDAILRDVNETTGQVARVRGLQRGVREALAGAVGRVEVLSTERPSLKFEM